MQLATLSLLNSNASCSRKKKLAKEEIDFRDRKEAGISRFWKIATVSSLFMTVLSGMITSVSIGSLVAAFNNNCIFYSNMTVKGLDEIAASGSNLTLYYNNIVIMYGSLEECFFCEYCSVASSVFGCVLGILFLQCGRGGISTRSHSQSWQIVPPALLINVIFFVLSLTAFVKTTSGLSYFCNHLRSETNSGEPAQNITTCKKILAFNFPDDIYDTDLYLNYILAQVASFFTFFGWLIALFVLILRCFIPVDFTVSTRRLYQTHIMRSDEIQETNAQSSTLNGDSFPFTPSSVGNVGQFTENTTSFSFSASTKSGRYKKLP